MVTFKAFEDLDTFEERCSYYFNYTCGGDYYDIDYCLRILLIGDYVFDEWMYSVFSNREIDRFILMLKEHYFHLMILRDICNQKHRVRNDADDYKERIQFIQKTFRKYQLFE